jgi:hypothetical protein
MPDTRADERIEEPPLVYLIFDETSSYFGASGDDLRSRGPGEAVEAATRLAMYLIHDLTEFSIVRVAEFFRGADVELVRIGYESVVIEMQERGHTYHQVKDLTQRIRKRELAVTYEGLGRGVEQIGHQLGPIIRRSGTHARELTNDLSALDEIRLQLQELLGVVDRLLGARKLAEEITAATERLTRSR